MNTIAKISNYLSTENIFKKIVVMLLTSSSQSLIAVRDLTLTGILQKRNENADDFLTCKLFFTIHCHKPYSCPTTQTKRP